MDTQKSMMILYDIASAAPVRPFSPNPWKARYALNFTSTPHSTTWVPLPDVAATRKKLGIAASRKHLDGTDFLTLPILYDPATANSQSSTEQDGTYVGDSFDIAIYLNNKHSSTNERHPTLFPPDTIALHRAFNAHVDAIFSIHSLLAGWYMPLDPATAEASKAEFARRAGVARWEDFEIPEGERKNKLAAFEADLGSKLAVWFLRRDEGPFLEGKTPMYADLIVGGWLQMNRNCLPEWEEMRGWHGGLWGKLYDALEQWADVP